MGEDAQACFASPTCWSNYKIIDAAGVLLLLDTGLEPASPAARLAGPERARAGALAILERDLPRSIGREAEARGRGGTLSGLGLLSDQPTYPLAYHAMSVAALARALQVLGDDAPAEARELFRRAMLAQASVHGPRWRRRLHRPRAGRVLGACGHGLRGRVLRAHVPGVARAQRRDLRDAGDPRRRTARAAARLPRRPAGDRPAIQERGADRRGPRALRARDDVQRAQRDVPRLGRRGGRERGERRAAAAAAGRRRLVRGPGPLAHGRGAPRLRLVRGPHGPPGRRQGPPLRLRRRSRSSSAAGSAGSTCCRRGRPRRAVRSTAAGRRSSRRAASRSRAARTSRSIPRAARSS